MVGPDKKNLQTDEARASAWTEKVTLSAEVTPNMEAYFNRGIVAAQWVSRRLESYMILSSRRPPGFGNGDLFVAFRQEDGRWGAPVNLGPAVNAAEHEFCPMVTPDGKFLFFSRRWGATWETTTAGDVYWVDAGVLDKFRPGQP